MEHIKGAMQWDLWNPWAGWYELNSTHPLVAKRLNYLGDQAAHLGQEPLFVFDRVKPESYWDDFFVDLFVWPCRGSACWRGSVLLRRPGALPGAWHLGWLALAAGACSAGRASAEDALRIAPACSRT